ncbi:hypothetical protein G5B37_02525 [Rasiella rasia]|uniref:Uncharacterized protein n=1 Tax=Rasiella rasia TaxID=2744027 RepID=A0A6G6GIS3_9FLAO|nr:hypothetical protein [Rasiella rasia]QIE58475.1 hypothetical protein G5B37_02525 [Rasiella rasia]
MKLKASNRYDLQQKVGDEISRNCNHCGTIEKRHINMLVAEPSAYLIWVCLAAIVIITGLFWYYGFVALISFSAPIWFYYEAQRQASYFNKNKISRK